MCDVSELIKHRNKYNWLQKTFRVRDSVVEAYKYLEFLGIRKGIPKYALFDYIVLSSINYIDENSVTYSMEEYLPRRHPKGFTIRDTTFSTLYKFIDKKGILVAEAIELLIYVFIINKLSDSERDLINANWGIKVSEN